MNEKTSTNWIPEIMYEDDEMGMTSKIPFIMVPKEEKMPKILFMFESRDTGEVEPGEEGNELPIYEMELHQYADMAILKEGLPQVLYDQIRACLGLQPLKSAVTAGQQITNNIRDKINQ